jgi:mono/diheme cytochrome c family protein
MRRRSRRAAVIVVTFVVLAAAACAPFIWRPAMPPIKPPPRSLFTDAAIARGAELAAVGDCAVCHTTSDGPPYAGGLKLPTPFGAIYAANITPDAATGIGTWSEATFSRAMRDGVDADGRFLYPAMPYPHFTDATDQDIAALYAFLMTRMPVAATTPPNQLPFPLNMRPVVAGWNLLFLRHKPFQPDPAQSAEWNRGAYLATALGHCAFCHTPLNVLGAEQQSKPFAGGQAEGWDAPALQAASPADIPWTVDALTVFLRTGLSPQHGAAAGPMRDVTGELATVPETDVHAIAVYFASLLPKTSVVPSAPATASTGSAVFAGACAGCHGADAPMMQRGAPSLALSSVINEPSPRDAIQMVLNGIPWQGTKAGPYMPAFAAVLSDQQLADLVRYLRSTFSGEPAWGDVDSQVHSARQNGGKS